MRYAANLGVEINIALEAIEEANREKLESGLMEQLLTGAVRIPAAG